MGIWALIDFIFAVAVSMRDRQGKLIRNWQKRADPARGERWGYSICSGSNPM
jgi:hypothetical protein